jgi:Holliday junction resolvase RusA-like endonuclease
MTAHTIFIPIAPVPAPRPRVVRIGGKSVAYNDPKYTAYKYSIGLIAKSKIKKPLPESVCIKIEFFYQIPKSWTKKEKAEAKWHTSKPDIDNLIKGCMDALNGIAYEDDSQVVQVSARKQYAQFSGVQINVVCA